MRTIRKRLLALLLTVAMLGTLFAGLPIASAASEALGNVTDAAVDGNTLLLTIDSGGSASDLLTLEVCQDNILRVDYQPESVEPSPDTPIIDPELTWDTTTATEIDITGDPIVIQTDGMRIEISRTPCRMTVMQADGTTLFWEPESGGIYHDGVRFVRAESSNMYGIHGFDCFSDNGNLLRNDNSSTAAAGQQGNSGGPFMWSTAGYGILVDSDGGYPYTNSTDRKMEFYYGGTPAEGRRYEKEDVEYSDAWMFGEWLLVAPITERGQSVKWIYLPEGTWIDYNRGTVYEGGQYIPYSLNSESWTDIPMFIKEGAIIPTQDVQDYVGQETVDHVTVDIFPSGRETSFRYYDDDGETYDYEDGVYFTQEISAQGTGNTEVKIGAVDGSHNSGLDYYYLAVHGQAATEVTSNGSLPYYDDYNALLAAPGEGWTVGKDVYGDVTYIKAYAASDSNSTYTLEGSSPVDADGQTYEAEYASLFGASTDTQASVNQNHSGYSGAGFVDKLEAAGAGVTFYAKVANAGDYDVTFRYANGDAAERSLSVYVNGSYIGKTIMPSTGHWDTWADCLMQLPLAAGNNIITLKHEDASGDTGYVNLDSCTVPFYPEVITAEAENAALYGTAGTNQDHWNYSGSGFVDGMTSAGAGAEFEITVPKDGSYEASIRYCNGTQATEDLNLYVNGSYIETISFGSIGGNWNEWQELTQTLELDEGRNVVALRYDSSNSGNVNLDKLSVKTEPDATISVPLVDNGGFERDTSQSSAWTEWHPDGQAVAYGVDSGSGTNPPESPYAGDKRVYFYSSSAYQQSIHQGINLPNGTYTVQAWIKVSNTAPDIGRMEATGYGGDSIYVDMPYAGTGWRLVETDITVTTGYLDIGLYCSSLGGTTVHIDNVKILNK